MYINYKTKCNCRTGLSIKIVPTDLDKFISDLENLIIHKNEPILGLKRRCLDCISL